MFSNGQIFEQYFFGLAFNLLIINCLNFQSISMKIYKNSMNVENMGINRLIRVTNTGIV